MKYDTFFKTTDVYERQILIWNLNSITVKKKSKIALKSFKLKIKRRNRKMNVHIITTFVFDL